MPQQHPRRGGASSHASHARCREPENSHTGASPSDENRRQRGLMNIDVEARVAFVKEQKEARWLPFRIC